MRNINRYHINTTQSAQKMINPKYKSGFSTLVNLTMISIISGGILTTTLFTNQSKKEKAEIHAEQVSKYFYAIRARVSTSNGKAVSNNSASDKATRIENQQKGTIWPSTASTSLVSTCITNSETSCGSLMTGNSADKIHIGTLSSMRYLFVPQTTTCEYYTSDTNAWYADVAISNVLPCNYFRLRGPISTSLDYTPSTTNTVPVAIKYSPATNPQENIDINKTYSIDLVDMFIPLNLLTHSDKPISALYFVNKLEQKMADYTSISIVRLPSSGGSKTSDIEEIMKGTQPSYGVSAATLLSPECRATTSGQDCFVRISFNPNQAPSMGNAESGCSGCLKQDGTNSMYEGITFFTEDGTDIGNKALLAWNVNAPEGHEAQEVPSIANVYSGIVRQLDSGIESLEFRLTNGDPIIRISTDRSNPEMLSVLDLSTGSISMTTGGTQYQTGLKIEDQKINMNLNTGLANGSATVFDTDFHKTEPRIAIGFGLDPTKDRAEKGITITSGDFHPELSIGDHDDLGVEFTESGWYKIADVGSGSVAVVGLITEWQDEDSAHKALVNLMFTSAQVTGNVSGDIGTGAKLLMTKTPKKLVYLYLNSTASANINVKVSEGATLLLTKDSAAQPNADADFDFSLNIQENTQVTNPAKSNIMRVTLEGVLEMDQQRIRISKPLTDFPEYPGDCAYTLDANDCPDKATEFVQFLKEVPNIEKTIDLIKAYTPNKYVAFKSDWTPIQSLSDENTGIYAGVPTFIEFPYKDENGVIKPLRTLPERVRVVIRADKDKCTIPITMADIDGYFYQEAHPSQTTDDDLRDTGAGASYSFSKSAVQVYAPTQNNGTNRRYLFYTYDGWGSEARKFHCDFGHVQVTIYRPEQVVREVLSLYPQSPAPKQEIVKIDSKDIQYKNKKAQVGVYTRTLTPGSYLVYTSWVRRNTGWSASTYGATRANDDVRLILTGTGGVKVNGDTNIWVFGQPNANATTTDSRETGSTFNTVQVSSSGVLSLSITADATFSADINVSIDRMDLK